MSRYVGTYVRKDNSAVSTFLYICITHRVMRALSKGHATLYFNIAVIILEMLV